MKKIKYRKGYEYQLAKEYHLAGTGICPKHDIDIDFIRLSTTGDLMIKRGYAWDGPSGPAPHLKSLMRPSLIHDALYQLMREGHLCKSNRKAADRILRDTAVEDGMGYFSAKTVYLAVRLFAAPAITDRWAKRLETAP